MVFCWEDLELYSHKLLLRVISVSFHIKDVIPLVLCLKRWLPQRGAHGIWTYSGGVKEESLAAQDQLLDPAFKFLIFVVVYHPALTFLLYKGLNCLLEQGIWKYSIIFPIILVSGTMCVHQKLIRLPWNEGFPQLRCPSWGGNNSNHSSDPQKKLLTRIYPWWVTQWLGDDIWLGRYNLINQCHVPGYVFTRDFFLTPWVFSFGLIWTLVGIHKQKFHIGGNFLTFMSFLRIVYLSDYLWRDFTVQQFSLWFQKNIYLWSHPKRYSVDHNLSMYALVRSDPNTYLYTSYKLLGSCDRLFFRVRRSYNASRVSSWTQIRIFRVSPKGASLMRSSGVKSRWSSSTFCYIKMLTRDRCHM